MSRQDYTKSIKMKWFSLSERDRKILSFGIVAASIILFLKYALLPTFAWRDDLSSKLNVSHLKIKKMQKIIEDRDRLGTELNQLTAAKAEISNYLIVANNVELAEAQLIQKVRSLATDAGITTSRISTNQIKGKDKAFQEISVNIPSMRCDMKQLYDFLVNIKESQTLLLLREMRIRVTNMKDPNELSVNMEISGFMLISPAPAEIKEDTENS